jgi:hypothetical protein
MPNIFIANYTGFDFEKAEKFGEKIHNLTRGYVDVISVEQINKMVVDKIRNANKEDYLLIAGPTILNCIIVFLWLKYHGICKTLVWKKKNNAEGDYEEVILHDFNFEPVADVVAVNNGG